MTHRVKVWVTVLQGQTLSEIILCVWMHSRNCDHYSNFTETTEHITISCSFINDYTWTKLYCYFQEQIWFDHNSFLVGVLCYDNLQVIFFPFTASIYSWGSSRSVTFE